MAALNTVANGTQIVTVWGVIAQRVGAFSAAEIDLDIVNSTPNSNPEEALAWIRALLTAKGLNPDSLTDLQVLYGFTAQLLYSWIFYWQASRQLEGCPEECRDEEKYHQNLNRAKRILCEKLKALGVTDPVYCKYANSGLSAFGITNKFNPEKP